MGEVNIGGGNGEGDEKECVCDSETDNHMTIDISMFEKLEEISLNFFVKWRVEFP